MVQFTPEYLVAVVGLAVGAAAGGSLTGLIRRSGDQSRIDIWDARVPAPLLLATAGAHLVLIPVVELQRQVMFGLYFVALLATVGLAIAGWRIWRLGAVLLPAGSILAYEFFAGKAHEADVIGLAVKLVELAAIAAALRPVF
ncbi:MAG: hypothetical protein DMF98_23665, partial [Acidobacteria bacterium]